MQMIDLIGLSMYTNISTSNTAATGIGLCPLSRLHFHLRHLHHYHRHHHHHYLSVTRLDLSHNFQASRRRCLGSQRQNSSIALLLLAVFFSNSRLPLLGTERMECIGCHEGASDKQRERKRKFDGQSSASWNVVCIV